MAFGLRDRKASYHTELTYSRRANPIPVMLQARELERDLRNLLGTNAVNPLQRSPRDE